MIPCLASGFVMTVVAGLFVMTSIALILIVLLQKGRGGGISSAFGGGSATGLLGSKTGDFLTWVTIGLVAVFLTLGVLMAKYYKPTTSDYGKAVDANATSQSGTPNPKGASTGVTEGTSPGPSAQAPGQAAPAADAPPVATPPAEANASTPAARP